MADANVSGYGAHPTVYAGLSDGALFSLYRQEAWFGLDEGHRQQLLQETVNRSAKANGEIGSCLVVFSDKMPMNVSGEQYGSVIALNRTHFVEERMTKSYKGTEVSYPLKDANMRAMTTVFHEDLHAWQGQVIRGEIPCANPGKAMEYKANDFTVSEVKDEEGNVLKGSQYLTGETGGNLGYCLYYLQSTERDAHRLSEVRTQYIMDYLARTYGDEESFQSYRKELEVNGYQATLAFAKSLFQNENVEKDVNATLMNAYYDMAVPADPATERLVKAEMVKSYEEMQKTVTAKEEYRMAVDWANLSVSREEYDRTLRDSVNAYYAHALNDPSMSKDEAIQSTGQMAEQYENAMAEFDAAHAQADAASNNGAGSGQTAGEGQEGGLDGGSADGGISSGDGEGGPDGPDGGNDGDGPDGGNDNDDGLE